EIVVPFLGLHGDHAAAAAAPQESGVDVGLESGFAGEVCPTAHDLVAAVENLLGDKRLVRAEVEFPFEAEHAVVEGVADDTLTTAEGERSAAIAVESGLVHAIAEVEDSTIAFGV